MKEENANLLYRFIAFNVLFHIALGVIIFILYGVINNSLYTSIPIAMGITVINFLYWGYQFYKRRGSALYVLSILGALPFLFLLMSLIKEIIQ